MYNVFGSIIHFSKEDGKYKRNDARRSGNFNEHLITTNKRVLIMTNEIIQTIDELHLGN